MIPDDPQQSQTESRERRKSLTFAALGAGGAAFCGLLRSKLLSVTAGAVGYGIYNQATNVGSFLSSFALVGQNTSLVKHLAETKPETEKEHVVGYIRASAALTLGLCIVAIGTFLLDARRISLLLFGSDQFALLCTIVACSLPLVVWSTLMSSVINGFLQIKSLSILNVGVQVANLLCLIVAVFTYGDAYYYLYFICIPVTQFLLSIVFFKVVLSQYNIRLADLLRSGTGSTKQYLRHHLHVGIPLFLQAIAVSGTQLWLRTILVDAYGLEGNGYFQAYYALAVGYFAIASTSIITYALPKLSSLTDMGEISVEVNSLVRIALIVMGPVCLILLVFSHELLRLLYAKGFAGYGKVFEMLVLSTFVSSIDWCVGALVLAKKKMTMHVGLNLAYQGVVILVLTLLRPQLGFNAFGAAYLLASLNQLFWNVLYTRFKFGIRIQPRNYSLAFLLGGALALCAALGLSIPGL